MKQFLVSFPNSGFNKLFMMMLLIFLFSLFAPSRVFAQTGTGSEECPTCPGKSVTKFSVGRVEEFAAPIAKANVKRACRPPEGSNEDLSEFFEGKKSREICSRIANNNVIDFRKAMREKFEEIEKNTKNHYCYEITDPAVYRTIRCLEQDKKMIRMLDGDPTADTIFAYAALRRTRKILVEFFRIDKFDINAEDLAGKTIYDYVERELNQNKELLREVPESSVGTKASMQRVVDAWKVNLEVLDDLGARPGSGKKLTARGGER